MKTDLISAFKARRSVYALGKGLPIPEAKVQDLVKEAVLHTPSPFNSQSSRVILLLGATHDGFWEAAKEALRAIVPATAFKQTEDKIDSFKAAHGTVLFFEDQAVVEGLQASFPAYKDNFPVWSGNATGMLQFAVWTSLAAEGIGASLQHYHPLVDGWVREKLEVPASWKLTAQMPFGRILAPAGDKSFSPIEERFKVVA